MLVVKPECQGRAAASGRRSGVRAIRTTLRRRRIQARGAMRSSRRNRFVYPLLWTNFPGTSRNPSSGVQGADFIGVMGCTTAAVRAIPDQLLIALIPQRMPATLPHLAAQSQIRLWCRLELRSGEPRAMRLEFHQLERRLEHLRVRRPERQRRLLASLAASGQQTPIVVVATPTSRIVTWSSTATSGSRRCSSWAGTRSRRWSGR